VTTTDALFAGKVQRKVSNGVAALAAAGSSLDRAENRASPAISAIRLVTKARTSVPAEILAGIVMRKELEDWQRRHHRDNFERER